MFPESQFLHFGRVGSPAARVTVAAFLVAIVAAPRLARASACCGDEGSLGQRLGENESAAFIADLSVSTRFGGFEGNGRYRPLAPHDSEQAFRTDLDWLVRASSRLEFGVVVPALAQIRVVAQKTYSGDGMGDVTALARFTASPVDPLARWPSLFATLTVVVPTGRPARLSSALGADTTGQGVAEFGAAVTVAKSVARAWFGQVDGRVSFYTRSDAGGTEVARAPRFRASFVTGPLFEIDARRGAELGLGVAYLAEPPPLTSDGAASSGVRELTLTAAASVDVTRQFSLLGFLESALPTSFVGANDIAALTFLLGGRYALDFRR